MSAPGRVSRVSESSPQVKAKNLFSHPPLRPPSLPPAIINLTILYLSISLL